MTDVSAVGPDSDNLREQARKRVQAKRDLATHVVAYLVINVALIVIWAFTGQGYFWPIWVIGGWGVGLVLNIWDVLWRRPITDADVNAELSRHRSSGQRAA